MKKILKIIKYVLIAIIILLALSTAYHHIMLRIETNKIVPNGQLVEINGHNMHVYAEGNTNNKPTLVFMSGSGTVAPVYDFKTLYSKLSDNFRIVVVEKAGYGYSESCTISRDVDTILEETRLALQLAGESGPYILLPHSMSGIEAIYWSQKYPEEINSIIGLDMALPEHYENFDFESVNAKFLLGRTAKFLGLHRTLSFTYPLNTDGLSDKEITQQIYLMYKNAVNTDYIVEGESVLNNSILVKSNGTCKSNILMFVSNGEGIGEYWIPIMENYANETNSEIIHLDAYHYIHYYDSEIIAQKIIDFLNE